MDSPIAPPDVQIFGNDVVTAPKAPAAGPTDNLNSNWTVTPNAFSSAQPTSPVVTSSAPAQNAVSNIQSNISTLPGQVTTPAPGNVSNTGLPTTYTWADGTAGHLTPDINGFGTLGYNAGNDPTVTAAATKGNQPYLAQEASLKQQRDQEIARLTQTQNQDVTALETTQANETGGSTRNLLAMGGYLGNNSFANSYLSSLQVSHEQAMQTLNAKYTSAIQAAQNAYTNNDFLLAEKMTKNAQDIQKAAQDRNDKFLDQTAKIQDQARQEQQLSFEQQKTQQAFNKDLGITGRFYQYPGSAIVYDSITGQEVSADQYAAMGGAGGDYKDIQVIDPSQNEKHSASFTEWKDYISTGGKLSYNDYMTMDANRKASRTTNTTITYNQAKDEAQTQAASAIGQTLSKLAGTDGYVSPADYKKGLAKWTSAGYSATDYNKQFLNYLNPTDSERGNYGVTK